MITSEAFPFAKAGGLADMVSALSAKLREGGYDVRLVMPRYYFIDKGILKPREGPLGVPLGFGEEWSKVYESVLPETDVPVYFLDHEVFFGRNGIYGTKEESSFPDNARRFTFLCRGAFQLCRRLDWVPDIMHAHDWPAAVVPVYLNTLERNEVFEKTASVLTIHNVGYQGIFSKHDIHYTQLTWEQFHGSGFEFYDQLNFLKAGIINSDILTTVSPTYAQEIQTPEYGFLMDDILRKRHGDLFGILNGIDYKEWNPENDPLIPFHYSHRDISNKTRLKLSLQKEAGLPVDARKPLIGMVSRLVDQKGFGELCGPAWGSLYKICTDMDVQWIILGSGDRWCEEELNILAGKLPNLKVYIGFDNRLAHWIEAGSDFFLMPSKYEPCGLNQLYSLRYGTLPIVRRTGGLADTVENYNEMTGGGTGFMFDDLSPKTIYNVIGWAVWAWYNRPHHIVEMKKRAMRKRFSWEESAARYIEVYREALGRRKGVYPHLLRA
ncbi:MAG: glycogen/starch synthase [Spirochaetota bacterium]